MTRQAPVPRDKGADVVEKYQPTEREKAALAKAREAKEIAPRVTTTTKDGNIFVSLDHSDQLYGTALLMDAIGIRELPVFDSLLLQLGNAASENGEVNTKNLNFMLGIVKDIAPRDCIETMLAS